MKNFKTLIIFALYSIPAIMIFVWLGGNYGCSFNNGNGFDCRNVFPYFGGGGLIAFITAYKMVTDFKVTGNFFSHKLVGLLFIISVIIPVLLVALSATLTPIQKLHLEGVTLEKCQTPSCYVDVCYAMSQDSMSRELSLYKETCDNAKFMNALNNNY